MSITSTPYPYYSSDLWKYSLTVTHTTKKSTLLMQSPLDFLYTDSLPLTKSLLNELEPRVLQSKCFNYRNLAFKDEVKRTEIAHLFEHILLEYLCQEKIKSGSEFAKFSGLTSWNWKEEPRGIFHVKINGSTVERESFMHALSKTVLLFETILARNNKMNKKLITPKQIGLDYLFVNKMHE